MKRSEKYRTLPFEEKERLWKWFKSQQVWHSRQPKSDWHKNQMQWYKNNAKWLFTLSEIMQITIRKHTPALLKNIQESNALLSRICAYKPGTASILNEMRRGR